MESAQIWNLIFGSLATLNIAVFLWGFKKIFDLDVRVSKLEVNVESWLVKTVSDIKNDLAKLVQVVHDLAVELAGVQK